MAGFFNKVGGTLSEGVKKGNDALGAIGHGDWNAAGQDAKDVVKDDDKRWTGGKIFGNPLDLSQKKVQSVPTAGDVSAVGTNLAPGPFGTQQTVSAPNSFSGATINGPGANLVGAQIGVNNGAGSMSSYQNQVAAQLAARANGQGPSVVDMQAAQQRQQNQAAIMSQLASARGGANPLAARTAMQANVQGNAQLDRDTMMAKVQEQQQAQQLLGQVAGQGRGQDLQQATSQAQLNQDAALTQYKGQLDQAVAQGQLDQRTAEMMYSQTQQNSRQNAQLGQAYQDAQLKYQQMGLDAQKANQMAALQVEQLRQSGALSNAQLTQQQNAAKGQQASGLFNAAAGIAGTALGAYIGGPAGAAVGGKLGAAAGDQMTDNGTYNYGAAAGAGTGPVADGNPVQPQTFDSTYRSYGNQGDGTPYRDPYIVPGGS